MIINLVHSITHKGLRLRCKGQRGTTSSRQWSLGRMIPMLHANGTKVCRSWAMNHLVEPALAAAAVAQKGLDQEWAHQIGAPCPCYRTACRPCRSFWICCCVQEGRWGAVVVVWQACWSAQEGGQHCRQHQKQGGWWVKVPSNEPC